jgi:hypothetical protein
MRSMVLILFVVGFCNPFVFVASAQNVVTTFPGTAPLPGMSAPVAFPVSPDSGRRVSYPIRSEMGVVPESFIPLRSDGVRGNSPLCDAHNRVDDESPGRTYIQVSVINWSLRPLQHQVNLFGEAKRWHLLFMPAGLFITASDSRSYVNESSSPPCLPQSTPEGSRPR